MPLLVSSRCPLSVIYLGTTFAEMVDGGPVPAALIATTWKRKFPSREREVVLSNEPSEYAPTFWLLRTTASGAEELILSAMTW